MKNTKLDFCWLGEVLREQSFWQWIQLYDQELMEVLESGRATEEDLDLYIAIHERLRCVPKKTRNSRMLLTQEQFERLLWPGGRVVSSKISRNFRLIRY